MTNNEKYQMLDRDFRDVCSMLYHAESFEKAEVALFYAAMMGHSIGLRVTGVRISCGTASPDCIGNADEDTVLFARAMWYGFADALMSGNCHVIEAYVRISTDASGTPVAAELQGVATDARFARSFKGYSIDYYHRRLPMHNTLPPPPPAYF